jgi:hypothetical protein
MNTTGKIVNLCLFSLFTLGFISPLRAESLSDYEGPLPGDGPSLRDEPYLDDDLPVFEAPPLILEVPGFESRSFDDIFPGLSRGEKLNVMDKGGVRYAFEKNNTPMMIPAPDSGIDLLTSVMSRKPSHIIEALVVVPYIKRELDFLDIYNALRRIKNIQDHTITVRGNNVKLFVDTTRIESAQRRRPVPDPPRADTLPFSETMYLRFVDQNMGDIYIRGDISISLYGITYSLTNFRDVSFSIFRIMKAESFSTVIYLEPVKEGILVYSMSGLYIPGFIAHRVNLTPNINYRITALFNWISDGLREEENNNQRGRFYRR